MAYWPRLKPVDPQPLDEKRAQDYYQAAYHDHNGNTRADLHARLAELGCVPEEARPSSYDLPWNTVEHWDATFLDDGIHVRLVMLEDQQAGFDPDGKRVKADGTVSRTQRTQRMRRPAYVCRHGHDLTLPGALTGPNCRECNRESVKRYLARKKQ